MACPSTWRTVNQLLPHILAILHITNVDKKANTAGHTNQTTRVGNVWKMLAILMLYERAVGTVCPVGTLWTVCTVCRYVRYVQYVDMHVCTILRCTWYLELSTQYLVPGT